MRVERKEQEVFKPITITLETEKEVEHLLTIANVLLNETLEDCCKRNDDNSTEVNSFGTKLGKELMGLDC